MFWMPVLEKNKYALFIVIIKKYALFIVVNKKYSLFIVVTSVH
jgi:hypothetical protein